MKQTPIRATRDPHKVIKGARCVYCQDAAQVWHDGEIGHYTCASDECLMTRASRERILDIVSRRIAAG